MSCVCVLSAHHWDNRPQRPRCAWFVEMRHQDATTVLWHVEAAKSSSKEQWKVWPLTHVQTRCHWLGLFQGCWESLKHFNLRKHKQMQNNNNVSPLWRDVNAEVKHKQIKTFANSTTHRQHKETNSKILVLVFSIFAFLHAALCVFKLVNAFLNLLVFNLQCFLEMIPKCCESGEDVFLICPCVLFCCNVFSSLGNCTFLTLNSNNKKRKNPFLILLFREEWRTLFEL